MKKMMCGGFNIRRGVLFLLLVILLAAVVPIAASAVTVPGAYGTVTVTTKNVVIRTSPAGSRTGYFAQPGVYPMIGPLSIVNGVPWYNLQTDTTAGFVHGDFSFCTYGGAGMPSTDKTYIKFSALTNLYKGDDPAHPESGAVPIPVGTVLQLVTGTPYAATVGGTEKQYINLYYKDVVYHTLYTTVLAADILTTDALNAYIADITWQATATSSDERTLDAKGDLITHAIQAALKLLEYYSDDIDGNYGPKTYAAVQQFRTDNSLNASTGAANVAVLNKLFPQASDRLDYLRSVPGLTTDAGGGDTGGTPTSNSIVTTVNKLRIRKAASKSSAYLGMIPSAGTALTYTRTQLNGTVTWYYIQYQGTYGWVMGTFVKAAGTSDGGTTDITEYGTVTITKKWTHIRKAPNGAQSGYHLDIGDVATMIGPATEAGGYTWYYIKTEYGRVGYVRGDCADADFGSAGMPATDKKYVKFLYNGMTVTPGSSPSTATGAAITVAKDTVLQLLTGSAYTEGGVNYINLYYDNKICYTAYNTNFINGLMTTDDANKYIRDVVWVTGIPAGEIAGQTLGGSVSIRTSSIYVHAIQAALYELDLYTDTIDGIYGPKTASAVKAYKTNYGLSPINDVINATDSVALFTAGAAALEAKLNGTGGGDTPNVGQFGTVTKVKKGSWAEVDGGSKSLFPKGTVATVMSVTTKQVFRIYRWSGANHADCVTYDTTDTAVLCSILGVTYNASAPSASELSLIKAAGDDDYPDYTWPKMRWAGTTYANTDKIPVWVNLNGTVYCASIYAIPHGYTGTSSFSLSKRSGEYYYALNNMYGMVCVHFYGSTTHSTGTVNQTHMDNINYAYNNAASYFGASKVE